MVLTGRVIQALAPYKSLNFSRDDALVQDRNSVETREGRFICFRKHLLLAFSIALTHSICVIANVYQHKVSSFRLVDPTKPGHRKIVALFLVDPGFPVPSASTVAPQQREWVTEALTDSNASNVFPPELLNIIASDTPGSMLIFPSHGRRTETYLHSYVT